MNEKMVALDELKNLDLHDQGLGGLQFDFYAKEITLKVDFYDEGRSDYNNVLIKFLEVDGISLPEITIDDSTSIEIYSHEVLEYSNGVSVKFVLLLGIGKPSLEISFNFKSYQVVVL